MQNVSRFFDLFTLFAYFSRDWLSKVPKTHVQLRTICTICTKIGCLSSFFNHRAVSPLLSPLHSLPCPSHLMRYFYTIPMLFQCNLNAYPLPTLRLCYKDELPLCETSKAHLTFILSSCFLLACLPYHFWESHRGCQTWRP